MLHDKTNPANYIKKLEKCKNISPYLEMHFSVVREVTYFPGVSFEDRFNE